MKCCWYTKELNIIFKRRSDPYVLRSIAVSSAARLIRGTVKVRRHESIWAMGVNACQGITWSEELDGKELHGAA